MQQTLDYAGGQYRHSLQRPLPWRPDLLIATGRYEASVFALWSMLFDWVLAFAAPVCIAALAAAGVVARLRTARYALLTALALVSTSIFLSALTGFVEGITLWLAAPLALLLVACYVRRIVERLPDHNRIWALAPIVAVAVLGLGPTFAGVALDCRFNPNSAFKLVATPGGSVCAHPNQSQDFTLIADFVATHPHGQVAYFPLISPMYMLSGESPPVSRTFVLRGAVQPSELDSIQAELLDRRIEWVVYYQYPWAEMAAAFPNDPELTDPQPWSFESFLASHYTVEEQRGRVIVYHLRG
jgi:hypothetical protein